MARGTKQIEGQLTFDFCLDTNNYVCQANKLIGGKQALKVNSAKLIRAAIMQVVYEDQELKPYVVKISELATLLNVPTSNIYRDIESITDDIIKNPVYIRSEEGKSIKWIKIPWVSRCEYNSDVGIAIKLNDELKPLLLNLKEQYTQYSLDNILAMKSVYAIRIFELLQEQIKEKVLPKNGKDIELSVQYIRECCACEKKYERFSQFKARVLDAAVKEINNKTLYRLEYSYIKTGKVVDKIVFHINMMYH